MKSIAKNFFFFGILFAKFSFCFQHQYQVISPLTHRVVMRYYLIARLTHAVDLIEVMIGFQKHTKNIHMCMNELRQQWAFLKSYRYIDNIDFERFVAAEILKISYCLFHLDNIDMHFFKTEEDLSDKSVDCLLNEIDKIVDCLECEQQKEPAVAHQDTRSICCPDDVVYRLYVIERLKRAFAQFDRVEKNKNRYLIQSKRSPIEGLQELEGLVNHNLIVQVVQHMMNEKKLTALFNLWEEVQHYRYAADQEFLGNMLMVIFGAYKNLLENIDDGHEKADITKEMQAILLLYENITILSTEELLSSIDIATDHLEHILNDLDESRPWYQRLFQWFLP